MTELNWTAACQASPSITNSQSLLKLMSIKLVMSSGKHHLGSPFLLVGMYNGIATLENTLAVSFFFPSLHCVACRISVSYPGFGPMPPALGAQRLNHWTSREVSRSPFLDPSYLHAMVLGAEVIEIIKTWSLSLRKS